MHLVAFSMQINDLLNLALPQFLSGIGHLLPANLIAGPGANVSGLNGLGTPLDQLGTSLGLPGLASMINGL